MSSKRECLRCGKEYVRLDSHMRNKNICKSLYLDISYDEMIENYDNYYEEYLKIVVYKCEYCGKIYNYNSGLSKHKKNCKKKCKTSDIKKYNNINNNCNNKQNIIINVNIDNRVLNDNKSLNVILRDFGNEVTPNEELFLNMIKQIMSSKKMDELCPEFFKLLHVDTEENRNLYIGDKKDGIIEVWESNQWNKRMRSTIRDKLINMTKDQFRGYIKRMKDKYKSNKQLCRLLTQAIIYFDEYVDEKTTNTKIFQELIMVLLNNKDILKEFRKQRIINKSDNSDVECDDIDCDDVEPIIREIKDEEIEKEQITEQLSGILDNINEDLAREVRESGGNIKMNIRKCNDNIDINDDDDDNKDIEEEDFEVDTQENTMEKWMSLLKIKLVTKDNVDEYNRKIKETRMCEIKN